MSATVDREEGRSAGLNWKKYPGDVSYVNAAVLYGEVGFPMYSNDWDLAYCEQQWLLLNARNLRSNCITCSFSNLTCTTRINVLVPFESEDLVSQDFL